MRSTSNCAYNRALLTRAASCTALYAEVRPDVALDDGDVKRDVTRGPVVAVCACSVGGLTFLSFPDVLQPVASSRRVLA